MGPRWRSPRPVLDDSSAGRRSAAPSGRYPESVAVGRVERQGLPLSRSLWQLARDFLGFVTASVGEAGGVCGQILRDESELLAKLPGDYLYHEHLDEVNHPVYFHEFVEHAATHRLHYLWEA